MITFPPSPVPSACDSLAHIDDLDAFLEAQGQLSHWPTPPKSKDEVLISEIEIDTDDEIDELDCRSPLGRLCDCLLTKTDYHVAKRFTQNASVGAHASELDIRMVRRILVRAALPPEILAVAYNIICGLSFRSGSMTLFQCAPSDLLVVSAMCLAVAYTSDQAPPSKHWSKHVCEGTWTAARIDKTMLQIFAALNWQLHELSAPESVQKALIRLAGSVEVTVPLVRVYEPPDQADDLRSEKHWKLKQDIERCPA